MTLHPFAQVALAVLLGMIILLVAAHSIIEIEIKEQEAKPKAKPSPVKPAAKRPATLEENIAKLAAQHAHSMTNAQMAQASASQQALMNLGMAGTQGAAMLPGAKLPYPTQKRKAR